MVVYFSATGNSRHAAEVIAEKTKDALVSLHQRIQQGCTDTLSSPDRPFVFVCPTYAWRIPRAVEDHIRKTVFTGSRQVYFILTCGGETANAKHYINQLCRDKGWQLQGFAEVLMPDNYIVMFPALDREESVRLNHRADVILRQLATGIAKNKPFSFCTGNGVLGKVESRVVNPLFYPLMVKARGFYATGACVGCGQCARLCFLNNIRLQGGRPLWGDVCTHCMACICGCPTQAIEYKNKTQGKPRYQFSQYW